MKNQKRSLARMTGLLLTVLILTACAPKGTPTARPAAIAPSVATVAALIADFPSGRFMATNDPTAGYLFDNEKHAWTYVYAGPAGETVSATGTYSIQGNLWIESGVDPDGVNVCPFPATYAWAFDGTKLGFTLVGEDKCTPRRELTAGRTFVFVP